MNGELLRGTAMTDSDLLERLTAEIRQGFLLVAVAILRSNGSSYDAMTNDGARKLAERLSDSLRCGATGKEGGFP